MSGKRLQGLVFPIEKRRSHLARLVAPLNPDKQEIVQRLPLFEIALRGGEALGTPVLRMRQQRQQRGAA